MHILLSRGRPRETTEESYFKVRHAFSTPFPGSPWAVQDSGGGGGKKGNRGNEVARILDCSGLINEFLSYLT